MTLVSWEAAIHTYEPDDMGRCTGGWYNDEGEWVACHSTQRSSTLHDDLEASFREMHDHGGGDCMCFESEYGPSYHQAMRAYVLENTPTSQRFTHIYREGGKAPIIERLTLTDLYRMNEGHTEFVRLVRDGCARDGYYDSGDSETIDLYVQGWTE
jgi:hypothetical protein